MFQLLSYIVWQRNRAAIFMPENIENIENNTQFEKNS